LRSNLLAGLFGRLWVRLLVVTVLPVLISVVSIAFLANYITIGQFESFIGEDIQQRDERLERVMERYYQDQGNWAGVGSTVQRMSQLTGERLVLSDQTGKVVADSGGQLVDQQVGRNWRRPISLEDADNVRVGMLYVNPLLQSRAGSLRIQAFLEQVNRLLVIGCVLAVIAGVALTVLFSNRLRQELAVLIRVTRQIGHGELSLRVPTPETGDLAELGASINRMAEDLERQLRARQQMVADVAHELRNPLQNINGYIEGLRDGVVQADDRTLSVLSTETAVLRRLVDELQDLSLADSGHLVVELAPVHAQEQVAALVESMRPRADELGLTLENHVTEDLPPVEADERRLRQVLANLLQNAFAYTGAGGRVWLSSRELPGEVEITVSDTGSGIAAADQERIFERFFRVDPARSRSTGGAGLGLTIARELVRAMKGEIGVTSALGQGSHFCVRLPSAPEAKPAKAPRKRARPQAASLGLARP